MTTFREKEYLIKKFLVKDYERQEVSKATRHFRLLYETMIYQLDLIQLIE